MQLLKRRSGAIYLMEMGAFIARRIIELLINTPAVGNLIREGKTHQLPHVIQTGQQVGMITFQQSYQQRVKEGRL